MRRLFLAEQLHSVFDKANHHNNRRPGKADEEEAFQNAHEESNYSHREIVARISLRNSAGR